MGRKVNCFRIIDEELSSESRCLGMILISVAIESTHEDCERDVCGSERTRIDNTQALYQSLP